MNYGSNIGVSELVIQYSLLNLMKMTILINKKVIKKNTDVVKGVKVITNFQLKFLVLSL